MNVAFGIFFVSLVMEVLSLEVQDLVICDRENVNMECDEGTFLAIHDGRFTNNDTEGMPSCSKRTFQGEENASNSTCTEDIRTILNYRCSGNTNCSFSLNHTHVSRKCKEPGTLIIDYDCVPFNKVHRFCNRDIQDTEGYIKSPGYPMYYPGPVNCEWRLKATEGQRLLVSILDLSMTDTLGTDDECPDQFSIRDGQVELLRTCGEKEQTLRQYESESSEVTIRLQSHMYGARRGILIWYKAIGCPTLPAPEHGYLVFRNISYAQYMCCTSHFFEDSLERTRPLHCIDGNRWNDSLASCLDKKTLRETKNVTGVEFEDDFGEDIIQKIPVLESDLIFDILVPSVIMATLIFGNAIIVIVLLKLRKNVKDEPDMDPTHLQQIAEIGRLDASKRTSSTGTNTHPDLDKITAPGIRPSTSHNKNECLVTDV